MFFLLCEIIIIVIKGYVNNDVNNKTIVISLIYNSKEQQDKFRKVEFNESR
jgi:hypothetical protein